MTDQPQQPGLGALPGAIPSPNIWDHPDVYEAENRGVDPDGVIEAAIAERLGSTGWAGLSVVDVGCGTGFHLPRFAAGALPGQGGAAKVIGVEPHPGLAARARERLAGLDLDCPVEVVEGTAQALGLPDASIDVVHARWAYFFGPGCEPGLAEAARVLRPGGTAVVIDHDATRSTFGGWFRRSLPGYDPAAVARFWRRQGFERVSLDVRWQMPDRAAFEDVVRIEFAQDLAAAVLAEHPGASADAAVALHWRRY